MINQMEIIIAGSLLLDFILGDPHGWWHPVIGMGWLIQKIERILRKLIKKTKWQERMAGFILWIMVCVITGGVGFSLWWVGNWIHPMIGTILLLIMGYQVLAAKSLKTESMKVFLALVEGDEQNRLIKARQELSMIVGRDTQNLNENEIVKATVETIAENTSDGVIAPLFYLCIFGPIGGLIYKAINTMDSMVGYQNEKYRYFGTVAAKMDDVVNWIPARLAALCMFLVSIPTRLSTKRGWITFIKDRYHHASPNSAQTESLMAGLLEIQLGGDAYYFGELHKKETMGEAIREPETMDILRANHLMYGTTVCAGIIFLTVRIVIMAILVC